MAFLHGTFFLCRLDFNAPVGVMHFEWKLLPRLIGSPVPHRIVRFHGGASLKGFQAGGGLREDSDGIGRTVTEHSGYPVLNELVPTTVQCVPALSAEDPASRAQITTIASMTPLALMSHLQYDSMV